MEDKSTLYSPFWRPNARTFQARGRIPCSMTTIAPVQELKGQRLRLLRELERKVLWLSAWTVHHANHLRPNRDGLKVGGHQASCASLATVMTALYFSVLRPEDRVAVKPHASPVFHAIQYLFGHQTRDKLERFRALGGAQSYPSRTKDVDDVDFSTGSVGLGVAMTLFASLVQDYVRLKNLGDGRAADRTHGGAGRRRRARRGQHLRGAARRLEARRPEPVVGDRLQSPEPRRRGQRPPVRPDRRDVRAGRLAGGHAEIRQAAGDGLRPARRRSPAAMDRRLPQLALLGAGLQGRRGLARGADARPQPVSRHPPHPRAARRCGAAPADDQPRRQRHAGRARRLRGRRRTTSRPASSPTPSRARACPSPATRTTIPA